jgi:dTDP-4-amino-4,6-dideoxygalactose transaminase
MQADPFQANRELERELCAYTGAPFAVTVNSCTMAILLACAWMRKTFAGPIPVSLPKFTYVGVPYSVMHAGFRVEWRDEDWQGEYEIGRLNIFDAARRFTSGMFDPDARQGRSLARGSFELFQCVSHHNTKILGHSQGGTILHNVPEADAWLRRARFDGRTEGVPAAEDTFSQMGWHCYLSPDVAAALRWKLASLPRHNADLPRDNYPDLSLAPIFGGKTPA